MYTQDSPTSSWKTEHKLFEIHETMLLEWSSEQFTVRAVLTVSSAEESHGISQVQKHRSHYCTLFPLPLFLGVYICVSWGIFWRIVVHQPWKLPEFFKLNGEREEKRNYSIPVKLMWNHIIAFIICFLKEKYFAFDWSSTFWMSVCFLFYI